MVQVGMQKQKQYDEGIQKIQTNIDNIAGLEVTRDVDKAYLQSKLNQLGSDLRMVAAGDFSNFQLVNSVNGMTNQIVKDQNVQNAVSSTARVKKEEAKKEKAKQEGKSSPENEWMFNSQVNTYLESTTPGQKFSGEYIEYKDVDKKLRGLTADLQKAGFDVSTDNIWVRDASGRDVYFNPDGTQSLDASKGGTRKYDMVKLTTKVKGIGAEKILNNFYTSLDEGDKRQLNITAQYHYRDATPITFQNDIIKSYNEKKKIYSDAIVDATVKLATGTSFYPLCRIIKCLNKLFRYHARGIIFSNFTIYIFYNLFTTLLNYLLFNNNLLNYLNILFFSLGFCSRHLGFHFLYSGNPIGVIIKCTLKEDTKA
jgi:hypothetical protein